MSATKPDRKPRPDSPLRNLPPERQAAIIAYLEKHSILETKNWLAQDGFSASQDALSKFRSWYLLERQYQEYRETTDQLIEQIKEGMPGLTEEQITSYGQKVFNTLAIRSQDPEIWRVAQGIRLKDAKLALDTRHIALLEKKAAQAEAAMEVVENKGGKLSPAEREAKLKQIFGMS